MIKYKHNGHNTQPAGAPQGSITSKAVVTFDQRCRVHWKSETHKRIYMAWCYGASTVKLGRQYGLRRVNEVIRWSLGA